MSYWLIIPLVVILSVPLIFMGYDANFAQATSGIAANFPNDTRNTVTGAENVFQTKEMTLGPNVQYLVILIPNEAHESPNLPEEQRLIGQPYVPQSSVITPETSVVWLNGDVGHDRKITLTKGDEIIFEGEEFEFNNAYGPVRLNETGDYAYFETDVIDDDPDFVMRGNISVMSDNGTSLASPASDQRIVDSIMVPAQDLQQYISELQNRGLNIDSSYTFTDLRGGQEGAGDQQTLLVWTANPAEIGLDQAVQVLQDLTGALPYS